MATHKPTTGEEMLAQQRAERLKGASKEDLAAAIREMDETSAYFANRIEALAHGVEAILQRETKDGMASGTTAATRILEAIRAATFDMANLNNCVAEKVGCEHVEEASHG